MTNDRPQDVGRPHRRARPGPDVETAAVLDRYRRAMRDELGDTLDELRPAKGDQLTLGGIPERIRPQLAERVKLWDLAIKLGRELANGGDELPAELGDVAPTVSPLRSSAPKLTAAQRRTIGA